MITPSEFIDILIENQKSDDDHLEYIMRVLLPKVSTTPKKDYCAYCEHCHWGRND